MTNKQNTATIIGTDPCGYGAAKQRAGYALITGARIADDDAKKLAQEAAGDGYGVVALFGRGEFDAARLAFGPVRVEWLAELDRLEQLAPEDGYGVGALRALAVYARQQSEALV